MSKLQKMGEEEAGGDGFQSKGLSACVSNYKCTMNF